MTVSELFILYVGAVNELNKLYYFEPRGENAGKRWLIEIEEQKKKVTEFKKKFHNCHKEI